MLNEWVLSLIAGAFVGVIFKVIDLPVPSPPVFSGILGITGIFLGAKLVDWLSKIQF